MEAVKELPILHGNKEVKFYKGLNKQKEDYYFINFIRFASMIGIVSLHCTYSPKNISLERFLNSMSHPAVYICFLNLLRFSLISFCLISGYLIAPKILAGNKKALLIEKLRKTIKPYASALLITAIIIYIKEVSRGSTPGFFSDTYTLIFKGVFWFIPMHLMSIALLVLLIDKLKPLLLGIILLVMLSTVTIEFVYIQKVSHTVPVFCLAFIFYFWLGTIIYKYGWIDKIKKINWIVLLGAWIATFILLNQETFVLWKSGFPNILNNLRVTNQLYAIVSFMLLVRLSVFFKSFVFINPRSETYGIYLYHFIVGLIVTYTLHFFISGEDLNCATAILYSLLQFAITYSITTLLVKLFVKYSLFGLGSRQYPKAGIMRLSFKNAL